jgi:multidrug resistance efflux pump
VARLEAELEARLRERLLVPGSPTTGDAVSRARGELERARDALAGRQVLSPAAGVVGDVRVRAGQRVEAGDLVASVAVPGGAAEVVAFLPGGDRPRLRPGQPVRLALTGYRDAHLDLALGLVTAEAMGADEARRYVGDLASGVELQGPVVMVRARAPGEFVAGGDTYRFVDGMSGTVEVEVGSERIIEALVPGLVR